MKEIGEKSALCTLKSCVMRQDASGAVTETLQLPYHSQATKIYIESNKSNTLILI